MKWKGTNVGIYWPEVVTLSVILVVFILSAYSIGRWKGKASVTCGPAQCQKYQVKGEISCLMQEGRYEVAVTKSNGKRIEIPRLTVTNTGTFDEQGNEWCWYENKMEPCKPGDGYGIGR